MSIHNQNPEIKKFLNEIFATGGLSREKCYLQRICFLCHTPAVEFKDEKSRREYEISITCQNCQDEAFSSFEMK